MVGTFLIDILFKLYPLEGVGMKCQSPRYSTLDKLLFGVFTQLVILSLPLIQEGQLPVSGERMCTILVNRLED